MNYNELRQLARTGNYTQELLVADRQHAAAMAEVGEQFDAMELFTMFNVECGDEQLWEFRKSTGGRNCVDKTALTPAELNRAQDKERAERVAKLRSLMAAGYNPDIDADEVCITDLLPKPEYV